MWKPAKYRSPKGEGDDTRRAPRTPQEVEERIRRLNVLSRRGFWGLLRFLFISIAALHEFSFLPALPENIQRILGPAPPVGLISIALVVYSFSALILTLSRIWSGTGTYKGWSHLGYLSAFYGFYGFAHALSDNFLAVFVAGLTILGLECYHIWSYCNEALQKEREALGGSREKKDPSPGG